jgi:transcriptional regulator with XRE-family HTH domain
LPAVSQYRLIEALESVNPGVLPERPVLMCFQTETVDMKTPEETQIFSDDEVRRLSEALMSKLPEEFKILLLARGIDPGNSIRMRSLAATFRLARESRGASLKDISMAAKIPQYRIRSIESGNESEIAPVFLRELSSFYGLDDWCARWASRNPELAYRFGMDDWIKIRVARGGIGKKEMPDYHMQEVERQVRRFVESRRPPEHIRPELDIGYRITGKSFEIFEIRPRWDHPEVTQELPVARATYVKCRKLWKLYWMRGNLKWYRYDLPPRSESLGAVLKEIFEDPYCCFWG